MKKLTLLLSLMVSLSAQAALEPLNNSDLQLIDGQAGADLSLDLKLNHTSTSNFDNGTGAICELAQYCRLGISLNNRNDDGSVTGSATGKKQWLVFKGIQGSINVQLLKLDGSDLTYVPLVGANITKPAMSLGFDATRPILMRNVGFNALAVETDSVANEGLNNIPGYLALGSGGTGTSAYANGRYTNTTNQFDLGRETGFMGLMINANLSIAGNIKMFSCDGTHPRC